MSCIACKPNNSHFCYKCGAINVHRSSNCDGLGPRCIFNCRYCIKGATHYCNKCGAENLHRSADCDKSGPCCRFQYYEEKVDIEEKCEYDPYSFIPTGRDVTVVGIVLQCRIGLDTYFLIQCRNSRTVTYAAGKFLFPGGTYEAHKRQHYYDDALRELEEETCINLSRFNYEVKKHIYFNNRSFVNFVVELKCTRLPSWKNSGPHSWESVEEFGAIGINACHGHRWMTKRDILRHLPTQKTLISIISGL